MSVCIPLEIPAEDEARADAFVIEKAAVPQRIVVALSGGVDSAVAAWLLHEAGHEVLGVSLRLAPDDSDSLEVRQGRCCSADDMTDARQLCDALGVPFYAVDARAQFKEAVFDPFVDGYKNGITPIPCLACNHQVKFGDLHRTADAMSALLATGHYARVVDYGGQKAIARPADMGRDQTYYLYGTPASVVETLLLPLGDIDKPLVRALAKRAGIPVFAKPDSQEICFVPDGDHARVVEKALGALPTGDLVHIGGKKLGPHKGVHRYTVGQRRGLGIATGERLFVLDVNGESGNVTVGPKEALECTRIRVADVRDSVPRAAWPVNVSVQVRARHKAQPATLEWQPDGAVHIVFDAAVRAVAPGQAAVIYDGDVLLGGGVISGRLDGAVPRVVDAARDPNCAAPA